MTARVQLGFPFDQQEQDICARKHQGNRHSREAHERVKIFKNSMRERCRIFIAGCGFQGATLAEICKAFGKEKNALSGRLSELRREGLIFDSKPERDGFAVYVARPEWCALWATPEVRP